MSRRVNVGEPPRTAARLLSLFAPNETAEVILGDLHEEFSEQRSNSGTARARSWYWRQSGKTLASLVVAGFRANPWTTAAAIVGGWLLTRLVGP